MVCGMSQGHAPEEPGIRAIYEPCPFEQGCSGTGYCHHRKVTITEVNAGDVSLVTVYRICGKHTGMEVPT